MRRPGSFINGRGEVVCTTCGTPIKRRKCECTKKRGSGTGNISLAALEEAAEEMCRKHWGIDCGVRIVLVDRAWSSQMACYRIWIEKGTVTDREIRMSKAINAQYSRKKVLGFLLHELVHWRLETSGRPYHDSDEEFVAECMRVGAPLSGTKEAQKAAQAYERKMVTA